MRSQQNLEPNKLAKNKALVLKFYSTFDRHDIERARELMSPDIVGRGLDGNSIQGKDAFIQYGMAMFAAFPDGHHLLEEAIAEGDKVVTRGFFRGTHQGELMGISPTGKQVKFAVVHFDRVIDGKIVEHWGQGDVCAIIQQLGCL
jgi:predicted ester cyclase